MTTAIDSNILVALWNEDDSLNTLARSALDAALGRGGLVIAAPVFAFSEAAGPRLQPAPLHPACEIRKPTSSLRTITGTTFKAFHFSRRCTPKITHFTSTVFVPSISAATA